MTPDTLAAIVARHRPFGKAFEYPTPPRDICNLDGFDWPCDAVALLALLRETRGALRWALHSNGSGWPAAEPDEYATAMRLAALDPEPPA